MLISNSTMRCVVLEPWLCFDSALFRSTRVKKLEMDFVGKSSTAPSLPTSSTRAVARRTSFVFVDVRGANAILNITFSLE